MYYSGELDLVILVLSLRIIVCSWFTCTEKVIGSDSVCKWRRKVFLLRKKSKNQLFFFSLFHALCLSSTKSKPYVLEFQKLFCVLTLSICLDCIRFATILCNSN